MSGTKTQIPSPVIGALVDGCKNPVSLPRIYSPAERSAYGEAILATDPETVSRKVRDGEHLTEVEYYNIPSAFDIETTSWYEGERKCGCMYVWQLSINGVLMMGRTWDEYNDVMLSVAVCLDLSLSKRLVIGIHNLGYEFQFMRKWIDWHEIFAIKERTPLKAVTEGGIEYRCTYLLSGYSLERLSDGLHTYKCRKAVGDLDYDKIRHSGTPLTPREVYYCIMDVVVVTAYLQEKIDEEGDIARVPLTKTGYVRRHIRSVTVEYTKGDEAGRQRAWRYRQLVSALRMDQRDYLMIRQAFQGGHTHASALKAGRSYYHVASQDFTSSYPAVIVAERFPMSSPVDVTDKVQTHDDIVRMSKTHYLILDIGLVHVESTAIYERIMPAARCHGYGELARDNGKVVYADHVRMCITSDDYEAYCKFYRFSAIKIFRCLAMRLDYLPTPLVKAVLELYKSKTELKGVTGQEFLYALRKEMCNSVYGMMVTDIIRAINDYNTTNNEWLPPVKTTAIPEDVRDDMIDEENKKYGRFLYYAWGLRVTSCARRNLYSGIMALGVDYIYSDTDSVKYLHAEAHEEYFARYNAINAAKMRKAMAVHGLPLDYWCPRTIKGVAKPLGAWDREPDMLIFKTIGAKRYLYMTEDHTVHLTVAGIHKKIACKYLVDTYGKYGCFKAFSEGLTIPAGKAGKLTHTYIDAPCDTVLVDYLGNRGEVHERSYIHLEPCGYDMTSVEDYSRVLELLYSIEGSMKITGA